ncbi:MAG: hypothetical protein U1F77_03015 [Kiritimatiellia bacterium]
MPGRRPVWSRRWGPRRAQLALRRRGPVEAAAPPWRPDPLTPFEKRLLVPIFATVLVLGAANLAVCLFSSPRTCDSMAYHLARATLYAQHGCIDHFEANYWAQTTHPRNPAILLIHAFLGFGRGENMTQLVQFSAYWASVLSVFGIARRSGLQFAAALFSAGIAALLVVWLMQAVTTQSDLLITSYGRRRLLPAGARRLGSKPPALAALAAAAVGTKSPRCWPSPPWPRWPRVLPTAPAGGLHPGVPPRGTGVGRALQRSLRAALRLSRQPPPLRSSGRTGGDAQVPLLRGSPARLCGGARRAEHDPIRTGIHGARRPRGRAQGEGAQPGFPRRLRLCRAAGRTGPRGRRGSRSGFKAYKPPRAHEDSYTYWAMLGPALVWPTVLIALSAAAPRTIARAGRVPPRSLLLMLQSLSGPDPWRGRCFAAAALVARARLRDGAGGARPRPARRRLAWCCWAACPRCSP